MIGERITRAWRHTLPGNDLGDKEAGGAVQARPRGKIETTSIVRLLGKGCHPQAIRPTSTPQTAGRLATLLLDVFGRDEMRWLANRFTPSHPSIHALQR
jgi:hypothetical protein